MGIEQLEQLSNEQVGAAAKALLLTWLITAEEVQAGELDEVHKLGSGVTDLLWAQAEDRDLELTMHSIGYAQWGVRAAAQHHDRDQPVTPRELEAVHAHKVMAELLHRIVLQLAGRVEL